MGSSQQAPLLAGLALLAVVASVVGRPSELSPLPPADLPKEPVKTTEDAGKITAQPAKLAASSPEEKPAVQAEQAFFASLPQTLPEKEIPVVIADLLEPEAVVVVPDSPRGRLLPRKARAHLPAEARGADGEGYVAFPYAEPVNDPASAKHRMSRTLPRQQEDPSSLGYENVAKNIRRHRVLFRDELPIEARSSDGDNRKFVPPTPGIQHSPASHSYEVREPGRETIVMMRPIPQGEHQADPEEKSKLQLIRHIHHQQFSVPFANPQGQQVQQKSDPSGISIYPPVFNTQPGEFSKEKPITGYFPFTVNDPALVYNGGLAQTVTDVFEYGHAEPACSEKRTARKVTSPVIRRVRALGTLPEDLKPPIVGTTAETPAETTLLPEQRDVGKLAGPVVQTITQDDDEDKMQTTIELGGEINEEEPDEEDDDDDDDDEEEQLATALDEDDGGEEEEEGTSPNTSDKGDFQKKLKDKLEKIEKKVRKRVKNSQANLHGIRKQVNRHVTEILMHSEGGSGLEEAGPIVSKLVVRRGGVAIAGPGGIATAGFGGTAIVGPGGTAYTSPDSLAVAGPGARVISVPSSKLQEMFDSFRKANGRNIDAFKPSWLGTIPPDGKLVATGPVVFFNPPEQVVPGFTLS